MIAQIGHNRRRACRNKMLRWRHIAAHEKGMIATREQGADKMLTEKAGATGDEHMHNEIVWFRSAAARSSENQCHRPHCAR
jgi:hypothetical protein